jgi:hypothetical protein
MQKPPSLAVFCLRYGIDPKASKSRRRVVGFLEDWTWLPIGGVALGVLYGLYNLGQRRLRDPRLDRDYSDDEPAPYDSPASLNPRMDQYVRMIDQDRPPKY